MSKVRVSQGLLARMVVVACAGLCTLPCASSHGIGFGAFSIRTPQPSLAFRSNQIQWDGLRSVVPRDRLASRLEMALTEEFINIKVNGDAESPTVAENNLVASDEAQVEATGEKARERSISDTLGDAALSAVRSLARAAGSDAIAGADYDEIGTEDDTDRFSKGAFGMTNVLPGRKSSSRRARLIEWQRRNLTGVRREIATATSSLKGRSVASHDEEGNKATGRRAAENGRMTPLVEALPSSSQRAAKAKADDSKRDPTVITTALRTLEKDMAILDDLASLRPQLSGTEVGLLIGAVLASGLGPVAFPGTSVTEVLAPAAAAFTASITIGSEYLGRVAVADGKEIAANTIQCAAEAEAFLANAERVKAITPLCVGVGATCASLALLAPTLVDALNMGGSVVRITELYLLFPLVSVLAAAVANLALEETRVFASRAINVGVRRFSKSGKVGRTWLSSSEQVQKNSQSKTDRWLSFAGSVLPAPIIGSIAGGPSFSAKCIVVAALAAAQSAYFLAQAESVVARATDAVALKARSAAVCDTYANQSARNSAILPFTSALSAFCAAATAAAVELPFIDSISALYGTVGEVAVVSTFPVLSSALAAAAAVSKARCEVDAEATAQAASTLALEYDAADSGDDPVMRPLRAVGELVRLAVTSSWNGIRRGLIDPFWRAISGFRWRNGGNRRWAEGG